MKRHLNITGILFFIIMTGTVGMTAQTVTLKFTGRDVENQYVRLNKVVINNLTKNWQETIWWPDTVLTMQNGTGVDDYTENGGFALSQNNPNPFSGTTDVTLTVAEEGAVTLHIADVNGRTIVETQKFASLQPGNHQFSISISTVGTYAMTARQNGKTSSIKMICNGGSGSNTINYLGEAQSLTYMLKSTTNKPFNYGDMMEYIGYATINGTEVESQRITQAQGTSQTFTLQFAVSQAQAPTVTTFTVTNISATTATCGGNVTTDGGTTVTARGVCWSSSTTNPTLNDSHKAYGSGSGAFSFDISGLAANTTYYVKAYATYSEGTVYGTMKSFTTSSFTCGTSTTDYDGNSYNTVQIGQQCWMAENLKTTHLNNGVSIPLVQDSTSWGNSSSAAYCYYNLSSYGCLYNYYAVDGNQLCPSGWHVPAYDEVFTELYNSLEGASVGGKMKTTGTTYWLSPNEGATNSSGFSARGGGYRWTSNSEANYLNVKEYAVFWTNTSYNSNYVKTYSLSYSSAGLLRYGYEDYDYSMAKRNGCSVRCLLDESFTATVPDAPTDVTATNIGSTSSPQIEISWNSVSNATSYKVYRSSSASGSYSQIGSSTSYTYLYDNSPMTGYNYYKVKAVNSAGESDLSSSYDYYYYSATTVPDAPTGVTATNVGSSSSPQIEISWNSVSNATNYKVYRSSSASGTYSQLGSATPNTYLYDNNPLSGHNYYKVKAVNSAGESSYSSYAHYNNTGGGGSSYEPCPPTVSVSGTSSQTVSWTYSTGYGCGTPTSFKVYHCDPCNGGTYVLIATTTSTSYHVSSSNVHPGINRYAVQAINSSGQVSNYASSQSVSLSYPSSFSVQKLSGGYLKFTWSAVTKATGYQVFVSTTASGTYTICDQVSDGTTTTSTIYYPESSGNNRYFKIRAYFDCDGVGGPIYSNFTSYQVVHF